MKLELKEYRIEESSLRIVHHTEQIKEFKINPSIQMDIKKDPKSVIITLSLTIKDSEEKPSPFDIFVRMQSYFMIIEDDVDINKMRIDCSRILFPYLRQYVSNLTMTCGLPPYYLPIINFDTAGVVGSAQYVPPQRPERPSNEIKIIPPDTI